LPSGIDSVVVFAQVVLRKAPLLEGLTVLLELLDEGHELVSSLLAIVFLRHLLLTLMSKSLTGPAFRPVHLWLKPSLVLGRPLEKRPLHLLQGNVVIVQLRFLYSRLLASR
jgi:hypothetical protein